MTTVSSSSHRTKRIWTSEAIVLDLPHFATTELALGSLPAVLADTRPILADTPIHATSSSSEYSASNLLQLI